MSDCCSTYAQSKARPRKHTCPVNGKVYGQVGTETIRQHITAPWLWPEKDQAYYFCSDPDCAVVYFGQDDSVIETGALRTAVGAKLRSEDALLCYCFGVSRADAKRDLGIREFVVEQTRRQHCACAIRNPAGKCCLADFPSQ
jgi:hypothetical protein